MAKLSPVQLEILEKIFDDWARPLMAEYRGKPWSLDPPRYFLALYQALFGPLSLPQITVKANVGVSYGLLKVLRGQPEFKAATAGKARAFADFLSQIILEAASGDFVRRLVLSEILVTLPGFDVADNPILATLGNAVLRCEADPGRPAEFKLLFDLLVCWRDVIRLAHNAASVTKRQGLENEVHQAVHPILARIDAAVEAGKAAGALDEQLVHVIIWLSMSLYFLANFSKIVV